MTNTEATHERQLPLANAYSADYRDPRAEASNFFAIYGSIGFEIDLRTQVVFPLASSLGPIFPPYLTSIIAKLNNKAWFKAAFPHDSQCELEIFIIPTETQHVVKELFDLHLSIRGNQRGILFDNGVFQRIKGSLELSGSHFPKAGLQSAVPNHRVCPRYIDAMKEVVHYFSQDHRK